MLREISMQDICKHTCRAKFVKGLLEMTKPLSQKTMNKNDILDNTQTKLPHIKIAKDIEICNDLDDNSTDDNSTNCANYSQCKVHKFKIII
jgi:hypothetical protein